MKPTTSRQRHGFTMIELVLVLVIMGLVLGVAIPAFSSSLQKSRTARAGTVIASDLELAFTLAARQRRPVRIDFTSSTKTYTVADRANGTVYVTRSLGTGSEFPVSSITFSSSPVDVYPGGFASASLTVTISSSGGTHTIQMTRAGMVRVT